MKNQIRIIDNVPTVKFDNQLIKYSNINAKEKKYLIKCQVTILYIGKMEITQASIALSKL